MTSTVRSRLLPGIPLERFLAGLFPCGSITGAPKIRAMEIIRELEPEPRGPYTGAFGYFSPRREARFNVAIRTILLEGGRGEMGVGSGLVADSQPRAEWQECLLKADFLTRPAEPFQLFETLLWEPAQGYLLLERHIGRLMRSARYFLFEHDAAAVRAALEAKQVELGEGPFRVRLSLSEEGEIAVVASPIAPPAPGAVWTFAISQRRTDPDEPFLYHKTTRRALYDAEHEAAQRRGCEEVVFLNVRGELTEGSRTNLFLELDGRLCTPALECGLLPGTLRQELLDAGRAEERVLLPADLARAGKVYLGNSVRGLMEARLAEAPAPARLTHA
jgi:para-aminobenzoate synthetase/4-amino-4-deoxychorismate lyase